MSAFLTVLHMAQLGVFVLLLLCNAGATAAKGKPSVHLQGTVVNLHVHSSIQQVSERKMQKLYRDNMDVDFALWNGTKLRMSMFEKTAAHLQKLLPDCYKRILIYNNTWYFADQSSMKDTPLLCPEPCNGRFKDIYEPLVRAMNHGLKMPNTLFILSVCDADQRFCRKQTLDKCKVPVFQLIKYAKGKDEDTAILMPLLEQPPPIHMFPWDAKRDRAFFRGTPFPPYGETEFGIHLRPFMANMSVHHMDLLDVGLVEPYDGSDESVPVQIPAVGGVALRDHARYRYLLALDGVTASSRLSKLMGCNSIILKSYSFWIEFYYRSLKEGVHHFSIVKNHTRDAVEVIRRVRQFVKDKPVQAQAMILNNLDFYQTYLTLAPRLAYWREALTRYRTSFPDMDAHIATYLRKTGIPA